MSPNTFLYGQKYPLAKFHDIFYFGVIIYREISRYIVSRVKAHIYRDNPGICSPIFILKVGEMGGRTTG